MKSLTIYCMIGCIVLVSGCASDLISPPYEDHPHFKEAEIARTRGDLPQAIQNYRNIIKNDPQSEKAYIGLGIALLDGNNVNEAKKTFEKALALFPQSDEAHTGLGLAYLMADQPEKAMRSFERALRLNSRNAKALNGYGIAYDMTGDHVTAQANYRAAMDVDPNSISYENNLALSKVFSGNALEAIRILERLVKSPNATPRVRQNLALAYGLVGDIDMAKKIGRIDLSNEMVVNNISYMEAIRKAKNITGLGPINHGEAIQEARKW